MSEAMAIPFPGKMREAAPKDKLNHTPLPQRLFNEVKKVVIAPINYAKHEMEQMKATLAKIEELKKSPIAERRTELKAKHAKLMEKWEKEGPPTPFAKKALQTVKENA
jgi:epoxyqueuosine reductase QueG